MVSREKQREFFGDNKIHSENNRTVVDDSWTSGKPHNKTQAAEMINRKSEISNNRGPNNLVEDPKSQKAALEEYDDFEMEEENPHDKEEIIFENIVSYKNETYEGKVYKSKSKYASYYLSADYHGYCRQESRRKDHHQKTH